MRISEMLNAIASWLESPNNEALLLAEYDDDCLKVVAESCIEAANALKVAADKVDTIEPAAESKLTPESIEGLAAIATAFDSSDDPELRKQASVIDELLLTIAARPSGVYDKKTEAIRIESYKSKYDTKDVVEAAKIADAIEAIDKSDMTKDFRVLEAPLTSRYCPDHPGVPVSRVGDNLWQCDLDKKVYDFEAGFELNNGRKVPGSSVAEQSQGLNVPGHTVFDTREERLGKSK